ncbi:hypothetical protein CPB86DRAFT_785831 [Serendipita vermifera]|nr:hypothetical protein CPB86DRAFT_785831 [Serendipita vermifera]
MSSPKATKYQSPPASIIWESDCDDYDYEDEYYEDYNGPDDVYDDEWDYCFDGDPYDVPPDIDDFDEPVRVDTD